MPLAPSLAAMLALLLAACAAQTPSEQLRRKDHVQVCQGTRCTEQSASTITREDIPEDAAAAQRLQALQAVAQTQPQAAYDLGLRLLRGDGVAQDSHQGIEWLRQAGSQGLLAAQLALGRLYLSGLEEMGSDPAEAQSWLSRAAAQGSREAQDWLPQAQAAAQDAKAAYQAKELVRQSWQDWYSTAPYYWTWGPSGWRLR